MSIVSTLQSLDQRQRDAVLASFLGWSLDAFDFFILVFVIGDVAAAFDVDIEIAAVAILLDSGDAAGRCASIWSRR